MTEGGRNTGGAKEVKRGTLDKGGLPVPRPGYVMGDALRACIPVDARARMDVLDHGGFPMSQKDVWAKGK